MNRRDLLKNASLAGFATFLASKGIATDRNDLKPLADCVIFPSETAGPFPMDLSKDSSKFRQAIQEDRVGVPIKVILSVVNVNDGCKPIANARVDLWHNDKDGDYSGFDDFDTEGETWCRGIQMTDANGQVTFTSIYPGWYPGRATHMHFSVYIGTTHKATSQLAFPDEINLAVYDGNPTIYTADRSTWLNPNTSDSIFASPSGALERQLTSVVSDGNGGYIAGLVVPIAGPAAGVSEPETGGQFALKQNHPNPFNSETSIPFTLTNSGQVSLDVFNMKGERVVTIAATLFGAGSHSISLDHSNDMNGLPSGNYVYQFTFENSQGRFTQCKVMTLTK
jgi:protocatechuate 3,4-dioxygenase beta subunit